MSYIAQLLNEIERDQARSKMRKREPDRVRESKSYYNDSQPLFWELIVPQQIFVLKRGLKESS